MISKDKTPVTMGFREGSPRPSNQGIVLAKEGCPREQPVWPLQVPDTGFLRQAGPESTFFQVPTKDLLR